MSAGLTASAGLLGGVANFEAGQEKASLLRSNAAISSAQVQSEAAAGAYNASAIQRRGAAVMGQQIANTGANNLQQAGTPAQVVASTQELNEMDALQTRNNALRRAWGFAVQGASDLKQADFAATSGDFNAAGTILGGGAKAYTQAQAAGSWF
jgi:hypothetical protein